MLNNEKRDNIIVEILEFVKCHFPSSNDRIIELLKEQGKLLESIYNLIVTLKKEHEHVIGGNIYQLGDENMLPIAPGQNPQFAVTPQPAGVATLAAQTQWSSADPVNAPVTMNASDPTGLTATVAISSTATSPVTLNLTWTYINTDGTVVTVNGIFTGVTDVTGGTMSQVV